MYTDEKDEKDEINFYGLNQYNYRRRQQVAYRPTWIL